MSACRPAAAIAAAIAALLALPAAAETLEEQIEAGAAVFAEHCAQCHGAEGEGGQTHPSPIVETRSLNRFRHAKGLYDYNLMMMPFDDPARVGSADTWRVTAWLMARNGWLEGRDAPLGPEDAAEIPIGD